MNRFFWKIAGADCDLLEKSGRDSQYSYLVIGMIYVLLNVFIFGGFFGMFYGVLDNPFAAAIGTLVIGCLISGIYFLTLMSLEPHTLPRSSETGSIFFTHLIRYSTVIAFAFFVSKCAEMLFISLIEQADLIDYKGSYGYMDHMVKANQEQPWLWLVTLFIVGLFILPVYMRHRLNRAHEYYSLKFRRDVRLVQNHYDEYMVIRNAIYRKTYDSYATVLDNSIESKNNASSGAISRMKLELSAKKFVPHEDRFMDPPFCTKPIKNEKNYKSSSDFINLSDWDIKT
jgi:hypothetical protein